MDRLIPPREQVSGTLVFPVIDKPNISHARYDTDNFSLFQWRFFCTLHTWWHYVRIHSSLNFEPVLSPRRSHLDAVGRTQLPSVNRSLASALQYTAWDPVHMISFSIRLWIPLTAYSDRTWDSCCRTCFRCVPLGRNQLRWSVFLSLTVI